MSNAALLRRSPDERLDVPCPLCAGSGWADPWEVHDGAPLLTWCATCLGAGLDGCATCDGEGVVAEPAACPCETGEDIAAA